MNCWRRPTDNALSGCITPTHRSSISMGKRGFPPELILEIAFHLPFISLLRLANTSAGNRKLLRSLLLWKWGRELQKIYSQPLPRSYYLPLPLRDLLAREDPPSWHIKMDKFGIPFERRPVLDGFYTIWVPMKREVWGGIHWLLWFLLVGSYQAETLNHDLKLALDVDKKGMFAFKLIAEIMEFQKPGEDPWWSGKADRKYILGKRYLELVRTDGTKEELRKREAEVLRELIGMDDKYFSTRMESTIWPAILQNKVSYRFLRVLAGDSCNKTRIDGKLDFDDLEKLSVWQAAGPTKTYNDGNHKYAIFFQHLELMVKAFPSYLNTYFIGILGGDTIRMDTATWVAFQAYEWILSCRKRPLPNRRRQDRDNSKHEDDKLIKKHWTSAVGSLFRVLVDNKAKIDAALRACLYHDFFEIQDRSTYFDYEKMARLGKGMYRIAILMLEAGADPNVLLIHSGRWSPGRESRFDWTLDRESLFDWTPLHVRNPPQEWEKEMFYAFLRSNYDGWRVRNFRKRVPAHYLVDRIIDGSVSRNWLPSGFLGGYKKRKEYEKNQENTLAKLYSEQGYKGGKEEVKKVYLTMLEALLRERPECLELEDWVYVLFLVENERKTGGNQELMRIVDEAEKKRAERTGQKPGINQQRQAALERMRRYFRRN